MTPTQFFVGNGESRKLFDAIATEIERLGNASIRVTKSQIAFRKNKNFALVWMPGKYLKNRPVAPLVLTLSFPQRDSSPRWKKITKISPCRFTHHLELRDVAEIDAQVKAWLHDAWNAA
jgi:predicted transport protein